MKCEILSDGSVAVTFDEHFGEVYPSVEAFRQSHSAEPDVEQFARSLSLRGAVKELDRTGRIDKDKDRTVSVTTEGKRG